MSRGLSITLPSPPVDAISDVAEYIATSRNPYVAMCVCFALLADVGELTIRERLDVLTDIGALLCNQQPSKRSGFIPSK